MNRTLSFAAITAGLALASFAPESSRASTITIATTSDVRSFNPGVNRDGTADGVVLNMVEGLVGYRGNGDVAPLLAERIEVSSDRLTYTFHLREGVTFHNGAGLTSADVVWNWSRYMDPKTNWRCRADFDGTNGLKVEAVEALTALTVTMRVSEPSGLFLDNLARLDCGMTAIIHKDSLKADGSFDKVVGTGPFRFGSRINGQSITLKKFEQYVSPPGNKPDGYVGRKEARVDEVRFLIVPDAATTIAAVKAGNVDIAQVGAEALKDFDKRTAKILTSSTAAKFAYLFQTRDPLLSKPELRQAIAAALDLEEITTSISDGFGVPSASAVHIGSSYYSAAQKKSYVHNPANAKTLLTKAGYKGEPITLLANRNNEGHFQLAVVAQAMLQAAGINIKLEVLDWATQLDRYQKGNYQMMSFSYSPRFDPALSYEQIAGPKDTQSRKVWENARALDLIAEASASSDIRRRSEIFDELHKLQLADTPLIFVSNRVEAFAVSTKVYGFEPWFASTPRLWNVSKE